MKITLKETNNGWDEFRTKEENMPITKKVTRRNFLSNSSKGLIGGSVFAGAVLSSTDPKHVFGANEKINLALIGCGGRGRYVARGLVEQGAHLIK